MLYIIQNLVCQYLLQQSYVAIEDWFTGGYPHSKRMFLLVVVLFRILYGVIAGIGVAAGIGNAAFYIIPAFVILVIQFLTSPSIVAWTMNIKWVPEKEVPKLRWVVANLAQKAHLPKPKVGISQLAIPNVFAFGRETSVNLWGHYGPSR